MRGGIQTARQAGTRYVLWPAVMRATPDTQIATCAHGWLCGAISLSSSRRRALARTGRAGVGDEAARVDRQQQRAGRALPSGRGGGAWHVLDRNCRTIVTRPHHRHIRSPRSLSVALSFDMTALTAATPGLRADTFTISAVSVAHGLSHFCQLLVPPLFPWLAAAFALSNTELGLLMTVFFVVSCGGQALAGFVVDHYGARRVLFGGIACLALAALGLAASQNYAMLLVFMALAGIGNCVFHPVDFSIINARVSTRRLGHAYAAHGISGNVGWALAPIFVVGVTQLSSWRVALVASAVLITAVLVLLVVLRDSLLVKPHPSVAAHGASERRRQPRLPAPARGLVLLRLLLHLRGGARRRAELRAGGGRPVARRAGGAGRDLPVGLHVRGRGRHGVWRASAARPAALRARRRARLRHGRGRRAADRLSATGRARSCRCCSR